MATVIDTLFLELGIDASKFSGEAAKAEKQHEKLEQAIAKTEDAEKNATKAANENAVARKKNAAEQKKADEQLQQLGKDIAVVARGFMAFTGMLLGASGLSKLAADAAKANVELDNTAKNLNMSRKELSAWKGAADMAGGSADGMAGYMQTLSGDIMNLVMMGDASVLPYFNALGVSLLDSSGKARALDDVMLDLADRMSGMDRQQAYSLARQMGMDDGTANALMRGRQEMERMLAIQRDMYKSNEADIENSRKLTEARAVLNAQWESLKLMIGNALIPVVTYLTEKVSAFVDYLVKNEHLTKGVFLGIATAISIFLIPMLVAGTAAVLAFIAPFTPLIAAVTALGAAFGLLYDDYKTWAKGGKSLFDWGKFTQYINTTELSTENLGKAFTYLLTGYTDWSTAANSLLDWLKLKGFIDANGVSVNSLITGFKNLAAEIADGLMPYLQDIVDIFMKLKDGDLSGAGAALEVAVKRRWELAKNIGGALWDRVAGTADIATGHEVGTLGNSMPSREQYGKGINLSGGVMKLTQRDIDDILRVTATETVGSLQGKAFTDQVGGIVDTVLNRGSMHKGGIRGAINQRWAFSDINTPRKTAYGAVENVPWSRVTPKLRAAVMEHLQARANGKASTVDGNTHYANPYYLHEASASTKKWVREAHDQAKRTGQIYGAGKAIHVHGTPTGERRAPKFSIRLPSSLASQPIGGAAAANISTNTRRIEAQKQAAQSAGQTVNKHTQVSVNNVTIQTTVSNMSGTGSDFGNALAQQLDQLNYGMS
ncbi:hypothetical protein [Neisseria dumasiana]|uniref:hypothetical protein n=1 Tax=Neisseria dumasiana TaxID=1931275 RepID=UPI001E326341|nr:hypothetical protein [Neisseria dumasiana]UOO83773.1 hypothetical protein LVJ88_08730 [Neisseria dumasiana]